MATSSASTRRAWPLPRFDWQAWRVWERNAAAWLKIYKTSVLLNFGEPFMNLLALGFGLGTYVTSLDNVPFAAYIGPGLLASTVMMGVTFDMAFSGFNRLHREGVYDAMITGPLSVEAIAGGEYLWECTRAVLYGSTFLLVLVAMGLVRSWLAIWILPLMILPGIIFTSPALVVATAAKLEDHLFYYFTLVITPMFMFSGIFFPVSNLPEIAQKVIWFTPLYHLVNVTRGLALGRLGPGFGADLLWLFVAALVALPWPVVALRRKLLDA
ncbi:MAG: ABC transporter permease [Firmicutes bacterium]|nr:ABC transporter permease [Bacillota bacterium]